MKRYFLVALTALGFFSFTQAPIHAATEKAKTKKCNPSKLTQSKESTGPLGLFSQGKLIVPHEGKIKKALFKSDAFWREFAHTPLSEVKLSDFHFGHKFSIVGTELQFDYYAQLDLYGAYVNLLKVLPDWNEKAGEYYDVYERTRGNSRIPKSSDAVGIMNRGRMIVPNEKNIKKALLKSDLFWKYFKSKPYLSVYKSKFKFGESFSIWGEQLSLNYFDGIDYINITLDIPEVLPDWNEMAGVYYDVYEKTKTSSANPVELSKIIPIDAYYIQTARDFYQILDNPFEPIKSGGKRIGEKIERKELPSQTLKKVYDSNFNKNEKDPEAKLQVYRVKTNFDTQPLYAFVTFENQDGAAAYVYAADGTEIGLIYYEHDAIPLHWLPARYRI